MKILFSVWVSIMLVLGLVLTFLGFFTALKYEYTKDVKEDSTTRKYLAMLLISSYLIGIVGFSILGLAIMGLIGVNKEYKRLTRE